MGIVHNNRSGFTIVELVVIITVIGILAGVVIVGYGAWQQRTTENVLKSDLTGVATAMESARNFGSGYPTTIPSTFTPSDGVTLDGGGQPNGESFCVAASKRGVSYHVKDASIAPVAGGCSTSCYDILSAGKSTGDGLYTITAAGSSFKVYCDMTTSGGGWTLIVSNPGPYSVWNMTNIYSLNSSSPSTSAPYSILNKADDIKTNINGNLQYRIDALAFGRWGGVWQAPFSNIFTGRSAVSNATNIAKYDTWSIDTSTSSTQSLTNIMPWISNTTQLLSTWGGTNNWWGTLVSGASGYTPVPYITPEQPGPGKIWYWVR